MVPFTKPTVDPETDEEHLAFDELEDILEDHEMSMAIGWAIQLRSLLMCKDEVRRARSLLRGSFQGRSAHNWLLLLLCAQQVRFLVVVVSILFHESDVVCIVSHGSRT